MDRSQWILDIEYDLSMIKDRLGKVEDAVDADLAQLARAVHLLAVKVEALEQARDDE